MDKRFFKYGVIAGILLLVGGAVACVVQKNPVTGHRRAYGYSWSQEKQIGAQADSSIQIQYGVYEDPELSRYVDRIGQKVLAKSHLRRDDTDPKYKNTPFTFRVLNSPVVNAFALPGGYVYVTRGLLAHLNNEAQLAVVLGHEIGHVAARHASQRAFEQKAGQIALVGGAVVGQEVFGASAGDILNLGSQATQLLFLSYSRDDEREADRLGVEYAAMAGYKAAEAADFFDTLKRISEKSGQTIPPLLSTHPDPGDRKETIPKLAEQWKEKGYEETVVDRSPYLHEVDHVVYGDNPREGFERDGYFYHPDLKFKFPVPAAWKLYNQPSQVAIVNDDQSAVLVMKIDSQSETPQASVSSFVGQDGVTVVSQKSASHNGLDGYQAIATAQTKDGQQLKLFVYALSYDGNIYQFLSYSAADKFDTYEPVFRKTATGFDRLQNQDILAIHPVRVQLHEAERNAGFNTFLPAKLPMDIQKSDVAILNQLELNESVTRGTLLKLVTQQ